MTYRPEYDPHTGAAFADPSTYTLVPLASSADDDARTKPSPVAEEGTPVRRKTINPSERVTSPAQDLTRVARQPGTTMLPAVYEIPAHVPREPTVALEAADIIVEGEPPPVPPDVVDGVTTVMPSAEMPSAVPDDVFDRVAWVADRMTSSADALGADGRPRTAALLRGFAAGMTMGATPSALERVGARLIQRALLADAGVAEIDDEDVARLLMEMAADVLVGVDPTRKAARAIARQLDERAAECRRNADRCRDSGNALGVEHHNARADELAVQSREIRRAHR